jgi:hypothetical protein
MAHDLVKELQGGQGSGGAELDFSKRPGGNEPSPQEDYRVYHRERILETSTLSCNEEEEEITKPPTR